MNRLGYPAYIIPFPGVANLLGSLQYLFPGFAGIKGELTQVIL
jgi:hypothetical protein